MAETLPGRKANRCHQLPPASWCNKRLLMKLRDRPAISKSGMKYAHAKQRLVTRYTSLGAPSPLLQPEEPTRFIAGFKSRALSETRVTYLHLAEDATWGRFKTAFRQQDPRGTGIPTHTNDGRKKHLMQLSQWISFILSVRRLEGNLIAVYSAYVKIKQKKRVLQLQ